MNEPNLHEQLERRWRAHAEEIVAIAARESCEAAGAAARRLAIAMARELGWSSERAFRESEVWARQACAEA